MYEKLASSAKRNTMKFLEFFQKKQENNKMLETHLLKEMSLKNDDASIDILNNLEKNKSYFRYAKSDGEFIEKWNNLEVYNISHGKTIKLIFLSQNFVAAMVEYAVENDNSIQIIFVNRFKGFRNLMSEIFINYILEQYSSIYSDNIHSTSAFYFYFNLFKTKNMYKTYEMKLVNNTTRQEKLIEKEQDMLITFGDESEHYDISYKIERI
jgi:hypothetical protein